MSSGISDPPANAFPCPNCGKYDSVICPVDANIPTHSIEYCAHCKRPYVVQNVTRVVTSVHKIEGIEPPTQKPLSPKCREFVDSEYKLPEIPTGDEAIEDIEENTHICTECLQDFVSENPCNVDGETYCDDCYNNMYREGKATHPDPEQYHCQECGLLYQSEAYCHEYGMCKECAEHSDFKELAGRVQNTKPEYVPLPDSRTVSYCIDGDIIKLQYKGNDCNSYTFDVVWDIVDSPKPDWMSRIDEMLEGEKNHIQKASALNQLCKAVSKGTVKIPGSDE